MVAVFQYSRAVYPDIPDADRELVRFFERGAVGNRFRIKDYDVGHAAGPKQPAVAKTKAVSYR